MSKPPDLDIAAAHKYFAASCFNRAWELIEKENRTADEARLMVMLTLASIYHWSERPDCSEQNLSVGHWQAARVYSALGNAAEALAHANLSLKFSQGLSPFYRGFAYAALARAEALTGSQAKVLEYIALARELAAQVTEKDDRDSLLKDLDSI